MSNPNEPSRRDFLKGSSMTVAGAALVGGLNIARSAHAQGSDIIKLGLIGCGGRGTGAIAQQMKADPAVKLVAVADAFPQKTAGAVDRLKKQSESQVDVPPEQMFDGLDAYKKVLACDVDLVSIATPPGYKAAPYKAAIEAGKHVFMEKPCCVDGPGFRMLMEANKMADEKNLFVGIGLQRRHQPNYMETVKRLQDGAIGDVLFTRVYWNGSGIWNRGREDWMNELQYQVNNWYHFDWLSGDNIAEQHIHNIDISNWIQDDHPIEANGMGGCTARYLDNNKGTGQIFDHHFVEFTYANGSKMFSQCRHMKGCFNSVSETAHGSKGTSNCAGRIEGENEWKFEGRGVSGHQQEQTDLLAAMRAGKRYNEGYYGATSSMTAVLGKMANYSGKVIKWDDAVSKGTDLAPDDLTWDSTPPVEKDANGDYPIPMPGVYNPFV